MSVHWPYINGCMSEQVPTCVLAVYVAMKGTFLQAMLLTGEFVFAVKCSFIALLITEEQFNHPINKQFFYVLSSPKKQFSEWSGKHLPPNIV